MQRTREDQANCAKPFILLSPIPSKLRYSPRDRRWRPLKDEIRGVAHSHGLTNIHETYNIHVGFDHGHLFANCVFKERNDAPKIFELIQDHRFEEVVMQAWLYLPVQGGHELRDGPRDPSTGEILRPPVPKYRAPAPTDPSVFRPRDSRGPCGTRSNQTGPAIHVVNRTRPSPYISQDGTLIQPFPGASIAVHNYCNNVDVPLAPHTSPYVTNLDLYQQRPGQFSPSEHDESELSDWSRTLRNTPEPSHSSRNSSVSAIFSASSTSNVYTPTHSRNESESSYTFQDSASDEGCQVIIQNVGADETHDQLSQLLDQRMPRYVQHEEPKRGEDNKWSVKFSKEEDAEEAKEQLDNLVFKGRMLKVDLSHGGSRRQINSGGSTTSATSPSSTQKPTIVDGSFLG